MSTTDIHPVKLARIYAELTQAALATRIGRTQGFVARLEMGEYELSPLAGDIHEATGLPESFFSLERVWDSPESSISYRKRSACPARVRDRALFYAAVAHGQLSPAIASHVRYPEIDVPVIPMEESDDVKSARNAGAEVARRLREHWGVGWGPIADVIRLVESKGVRVFFVREPMESLDGFSCWTKDVPYMFLNSHIADPARTRFDAAHELGHLVMHREIELDSNIDVREAMAHGFAAEFLAPWHTFKREAPAIPDLNRLAPLRRRWRMSMQAIVRHMYANGAIGESSYTSAFKKFSILGYRRGPEPGWLIPDASAIHSKFIDVITLKGISTAEMADSIGIPESLFFSMIPESATLYE